jgi:uncharacterized protein (TIGR03435 family)
MVQRLLEEQLQLKFFHAQVREKVYRLTVAKSGLKLKAAAPVDPGGPTQLQLGKAGDPPVLPPGRPGLFHGSFGPKVFCVARMNGIHELILSVEGFAGRHIIDETGLTGKYDFTLIFDSGLRGSVPGDDDVAESPTLERALIEQLGLQLIPGETLVDVLHVDRL